MNSHMIEQLSRKDLVASAPRLETNPTFLPRELFDVLEHQVKVYDTITETGKQYLTVLEGLSSFREMDKDIYWYLWKLLLYLEQYQGIVECRSYALSAKKLQKAKVRKGEFVLHVPGLQEDRPSLRPKDIVDIQAVGSTKVSTGEIRFVGQTYISIEVNPRFATKWSCDRLYDISFHWSDWQLSHINFALDTVKKYNLMSMLFPVGGKYNNAKLKSLTWINKQIQGNPEQQQAILNILAKTSQPDPYILFGPPGTGKTSTLIEAILQIHLRNSSSRILICTPSNSAADEIALKLLRHSPDIIAENTIYRLYSASRNIDDVHESLKLSSNRAADDAVFLSKDIFMTKKIVIVTLVTAIRVYNYELRENHFSYLFIDEAGQATEPETLIPLLTMCGYKPDFNAKPHGQVVLAGDPKQLGPSCDSQLAKPILSQSMLERLMSWGPYQRSESGYNANYVTRLVQNYRSHPAILKLPNELFYNGDLVSCGGAHTQRATNWTHLPCKKFPLIFHGVEGDERREPHSPSVCNLHEVQIIVDYVLRLTKFKMRGGVVKQEDIGIVTPYRLQRKKIMEALRKCHLENISVGTVESFQGQERDVIILSTVRSVLYRTAGNRIHIGFLSNPKRFNVAVTRAKALLIVIGNPQILQHDECWKKLMQYCWDHKAWNGKKHLFNKYISSNQIEKLRGKKHEFRPQWDPNPNLPVVEDPKSARDDKIMDDGRERRRRLPAGMKHSDRDKFDQSPIDNEEIEYWPDLADQSSDSSSQGEDFEGSDVEDDQGDNGAEMRVCVSSRMSPDYDEQDSTFKKLHERMQELEK